MTCSGFGAGAASIASITARGTSCAEALPPTTISANTIRAARRLAIGCIFAFSAAAGLVLDLRDIDRAAQFRDGHPDIAGAWIGLDANLEQRGVELVRGAAGELCGLAAEGEVATLGGDVH